MVGSSLDYFKRVFTGGLFSRLKRRGVSIGVDLGSTLTKFVVLQHSEKKYILRNWGMEPVPHPDSEGLGIRPNVIAWEHLHSQWSNPGMLSSSLGVSVSGPRVMIKKIELPGMSEDDIREHVRWELDRYVSPEMGDVFWDLHFFISSHSDLPHQRQMLLVVAQKDWVETITSDFKRHGQEIGFMDVDAFALANIVTMNYGAEEGRLVSHLGPSGMLFVFIQHGQVVWHRAVPFAVEWYGDLVDQIRPSSSPIADEKFVEPSVQILLDPFLEEVAGHIQDTIRDCSTSVDLNSLGGIVLSGGYAVVGGMDNKISRKLGLPVSFLNPFHHIQIPETFGQDPTFINAKPLLGVAVGVAVRGVMEG